METRVTQAQLYKAKLLMGVSSAVVNDTLTEHKDFMTFIAKGLIGKAMQKLEDDPSLLETSLDYEGNRPLHIAALNGYSKLSSKLLERGADLNSKNIYDQTPLFMAGLNFIHNNNFELIVHFLDFGCDPRVTCKVKCSQGLSVLKLISDFTPELEQVPIREKFSEATARSKHYSVSWRERRGFLWVLSKLRGSTAITAAKPQVIREITSLM
jgi:hypothetical protein